MIKANKQLGVYPDIQGNSVAQVFKTSKKTGKLIFENNTFYKEVDNVKTEIGTGTGTGTVTDPAGADTQVQYNDSDSFGASTTFTYNDSSKILTLKGSGSGSNKASIYFSSAPGEWNETCIQEAIPQGGSQLDFIVLGKKGASIGYHGIIVGPPYGESVIIQGLVVASVSNPPTNSEIEDNVPTLEVNGSTPTGYEGSTYFLQDSNTDITYMCYAIQDSTWAYTALTAAV
jgi:hypothetical protein